MLVPQISTNSKGPQNQINFLSQMSEEQSHPAESLHYREGKLKLIMTLCQMIRSARLSCDLQHQKNPQCFKSTFGSSDCSGGIA